MDVKLSDFIYTADDALTKEFCSHVIEKFENDDRKSQGVLGTNKIVDKTIKDSTDLVISKVKKDWGEEDHTFFTSISNQLDYYWQSLDSIHERLIPIGPHTKVQDQGYQVKRYEPDGYYHWHQDYVVDNDYGARALTFIWYLNDQTEAGETEFLDGTIITPKAGKLLIFPATWCFLHRGLPPKVGRKYIATGWLSTKPNDDLLSIPNSPGNWTVL